jgi:hypothetical protein
VAIVDPVSTPNAADARTTKEPRLPLRRPTNAFMNLTRELEIPVYCISAPANTKNGIARKGKLSIAEKAVAVKVSGRAPVMKIIAKQVNPILNAIGTWKPSAVAKKTRTNIPRFSNPVIVYSRHF